MASSSLSPPPPPPPPVALVAVMGLPGAGKTTLCQLLCRGVSVDDASVGDSSTKPPAVVHVEFDKFAPDSLVSPDDAPGQSSAWKAARDGLLRSLDRLLCRHRRRPADGWRTYFADNDDDGSDSGESHLAMLTVRDEDCHRSRVVLLDDNFYYASMRHAVFQLARFYNCGYGTVYLRASTAQLRLLNALRDKPVPEGVIDRMSQRLEAPNPERNPWERFTCVINECDLGFLDSVGHYSDNSVNGRLHALIRDCLANPFEPIDLEEAARQAEDAREICSLSLLHQADLRLRAMVSDWLAAKGDQSEAEKAELGKAAAACKRTLMNALRDGKLKVPARLNAYSPDKRDALDTFLQDNIGFPS